MCGRYRLSRRKQLVEEYFGAVSDEYEWSPRYNVAPSQAILTIRRDAREPVRKLSTMRWGLIPSWSNDPSIGYRTINARSETVATTASFREPFKSQRCLVPADGFYERKREGKIKQPHCFEVNSGELFAFAGLWDRWRNPQGELIESCTILTTTPNSLLADIHDRIAGNSKAGKSRSLVGPMSQQHILRVRDAKILRPQVDAPLSSEHES